MNRFGVWALEAQNAIGQTATTAVVLSLRGAIVVALSFALIALRAWRRF